MFLCEPRNVLGTAESTAVVQVPLQFRSHRLKNRSQNISFLLHCENTTAEQQSSIKIVILRQKVKILRAKEMISKEKSLKLSTDSESSLFYSIC